MSLFFKRREWCVYFRDGDGYSRTRYVVACSIAGALREFERFSMPLLSQPIQVLGVDEVRTLEDD